jgi:hypothetical protein
MKNCLNPTNGRTERASATETGYTRHEVAAPRVAGPSGRTLTR